MEQLDAIVEMPKKIQHDSILVSIDGQPGPSGIKKVFTVTPAYDP
jgi:hypothetical protein